MIGYKWLTSENKSINGDKISWKKSIWVKREPKRLQLCKYGLHASKTPLQSLGYVYGDKWWVVEAKGKIINSDDKFVASEMKIIKRLPVKKILVKFAVLCAKRCLTNYEKEYPNDDRPRKAIEAAENYVKNPTKENESAARSAAWSAGSARSAGSAGSAAWSARSAAWSARSAAWSARSAARSAGSAGSAGSAAWSARSAAWSARSAAWSARSAAWSARSAEYEWQNKTLNNLIKKYFQKLKA